MIYRLLYIALFLCVGCSSTPKPPPNKAALDATTREVRTGMVAAFEETEGLDAFDVVARYNPASCECPDYEIQIYGAWTRVYIQGSQVVMARLQEFADNAGTNTLEFLTLKGRVLSARQRSTRNVPYPVFEAEER